MPKAKTVVFPAKTVSLREFWKQQDDGLTLSTLAKLMKVPHSTLYRHIKDKLPMGVKTARKIEIWSKGKISAAKTLGVES
jgi:predicted transcriptional regulator